MSEHRLQVLLLWDMVASTKLLLDLRPERYSTITSPLKDRVTAIIERHGGDFFRDTGDGGWAGFTSAHDAVDAAVEMQRAVHRPAAIGRSAPIAIRVMLSAGDVWVGPSGDRAGLALNIAARLEELTQAGDIFCTSTVTTLATGWGGHESELVDVVKLRDVPGDTEVRRIIWQHSATADRLGIPAPLVGSKPYRFIGREQERAELVDLWRMARDGHGSAVSLVGPAGVGKSRLAAELAVQVRADGGAVLYGGCDEYAGFAYEPFVQAIETYVDAVPNLARDLGRHAIELSRIVPSIRERLVDLGPVPDVEPDIGRRRLFDAVGGWLANMSSEAPTLFVVDDFMWADDATANLTSHILGSIADHPLLVLLTARSDELATAVRPTLQAVEAAGAIQLGGLDLDEVVDFAAEVIGDDLDPQTEAAARQVGVDAGGNPFMVGELLGAMMEQARVETGPLSLRPLGQTRGDEYIPDTVRAIVRRRIDRLSIDARRLVRMAAVAGERFDPRVVQHVMGPVADYAATVAEAERAGILEHGNELARFTHSIVRHAVLADETTIERELEHRRIGEAIEHVHAGHLERHYDALAYQYSMCGGLEDRNRAIHFARLAAESAVDRLAHDQAVVQHRLALRLRLAAQPWPEPDGHSEAIDELR